MVLNVFYGNNQKVKKREFTNFKEANYFIRYNEQQLKCLLGQHLGKEVESKPKLDDELVRKVYRNEQGELHYYIMTCQDAK